MGRLTVWLDDDSLKTTTFSQPDASLVTSFRDHLQEKEQPNEGGLAALEGTMALNYFKVVAIMWGKIPEDEVKHFSLWQFANNPEQVRMPVRLLEPIEAFRKFNAGGDCWYYTAKYIKHSNQTLLRFAFCCDLRKVLMVRAEKNKPSNRKEDSLDLDRG